MNGLVVVALAAGAALPAAIGLSVLLRHRLEALTRAMVLRRHLGPARYAAFREAAAFVEMEARVIEDHLVERCREAMAWGIDPDVFLLRMVADAQAAEISGRSGTPVHRNLAASARKRILARLAEEGPRP